MLPDAEPDPGPCCDEAELPEPPLPSPEGGQPPFLPPHLPCLEEPPVDPDCGWEEERGVDGGLEEDGALEEVLDEARRAVDGVDDLWDMWSSSSNSSLRASRKVGKGQPRQRWMPMVVKCSLRPQMTLRMSV